MKQLWMLVRPLTLVMVFAALCFVPQQAAADDDDPPSRVARLSYARGSVSFQPAGEQEWVSAVVNRPMTTGDKLWADKGARAELHIGSAAIRLGDETGFSFLDLNDRVSQIRLTEGTIYVRLRQIDPNEMFEVDTPNLAFSLLRAGEYRIDVNEAGDMTRVSVRGGEGEVTGGGQAFSVHAGQSAEFRGYDQLESAFDSARGRDDFDDWCVERDRREEHARSAQYVSRDVIGYEDLDDYGDWRPVPEYGNVWVPRTVVVGWAPYRYGHWAWIWPWGWTWVDDSPWGFAPFHYGRWVFVSGSWGWVPCPVRVRPVYAPALVAWVGGSNFAVGISVGRGPSVGWFPLGPREVYIPSYRVSRTYVTNINVTNTTVNNVYVTNVYNNYTTNRVTNIRYVNRERAATVTSQTVFTSAQPVGRNIVKVDRREMERARVSANVDVTPQARSVLGAGNAARVRPPAVVQTRAVVAKTAPPPRPVPFALQQKAIEAGGGRPPDRKEMERLRPAGDEGGRRNVRIAPPIRSAGERAAPGNARPVSPVPSATPQAGKPVPAMPERPEPRREDRPPATQRDAENPRLQPSDRPRQDLPTTNRPVDRPAPREPAERPAQVNRPTDRPQAMPTDRPDRSAKSPKQIEREDQLGRKQQQEQQKLEQRQDQERQRLEQKHQEQEQRTRQQAENQRQQQEHQRLQQRQDQDRQRLDQRQQQQRQKAEKQDVKQRQKEEKQEKPQPQQDHPPGR